jgi:hypothetical protein
MNYYAVVIGNIQIARFNSLKSAYQYLAGIPVRELTTFDYRVVAAN